MDATARLLDRAAAHCTGCPKLCRFACPVAVADGRESSTPTAKMTLASRLATGAVAPSARSVEPLYRCTGCQLQQTFCKHDVDVPDALEAARAFAFERGAIPDRIAAALPRIRTDRDPASSDLRACAAAVRGAAGASVRLLPGCRMLRDDADGCTRTARVLEKALESPVGVWDGVPICCGYPLHALGDRAALAANGKALAKALRGTARLVAADPSCAFTLTTVYRELGVKLPCPVITLPEALAAALPRLAHDRRRGERWVFHDPCHLGRRLSVYDPPRAIVAATGATVVEPPWSRAEARCSGFGGLYPILDPAAALEIARARSSELLSAGADGVATACPSCKLALTLGGSRNVKDVSEILE
ncbi:MAG: (Fe-S)-binding protein [Acidobacteriota bacterium]